jgi:hypothetical protein
MGRLILPDFLIIGAQKSGTSAIWHCLTDHPDVGKTQKEKNFFNFGWDEGLKFYSEMFVKGKLNGDATPGYLFMSVVPQRVKETIPNAKFIVSLRNPIDRAYSQYNHHIPKYTTQKYWIDRLKGKVPSFEEAIEFEKKKLRGHTFVRRGHYVGQLRNWFNYFSRDQFLIIKFEDFVKGNNKTMIDIQDFLGLKVTTLNPPKRFSEYSDMNPDTRQMLKEHFDPLNKELYELLDRDFGWE